MKYNDNGVAKDIRFKTSDTLPIGAEVEYNGTTVPDGWVEVDDDIIKRDTVAQLDNVVSRNSLNKYGIWNYGDSLGWDATKLTPDGKIITYSNLYANRSLGQLLNLKNNTTYTLSGILISATGTGEENVAIEFPLSNIPVFFISKNVSKPYNFSYTFTTGNNANSIWISLNGLNNGLGNAETVFDNLQIEKGSVASPYVPYLNLQEAMPIQIKLFEGETNGNILLSDSVTNYKYLEIYYRDDQYIFNSIKIISQNNLWFTLNVVQHLIASGEVITRGKNMKLQDNQLLGGDYSVLVQTSSGNTIYWNNNIYVVRVIGYK